MNRKELQTRLFDMQDKQYKDFHTRLCPGTSNIIGIRIPILRKFAKEIVNSKQYDWILKFNPKYYEEAMLQGMIIGLKKYNEDEINKLLKNVEDFVPKIDNWAVCDTFCSGLKIVNKYQEEFWEFINKYLKSDKEFELRFAIVIILDYYINEQYIDEVLDILNKIKHEGYYVKMAVAWAISECYVKFPDKTFKFLKTCNLDNFTYNKTIQKIIESYRVDKKDKEILRKIKK